LHLGFELPAFQLTEDGASGRFLLELSYLVDHLLAASRNPGHLTAEDITGLGLGVRIAQ
jgi:hypothetical protein